MKTLYEEASKRHQKTKSVLTVMNKELQSPREIAKDNSHIAMRFLKRFEQEYLEVMGEDKKEMNFADLAELLYRLGCITNIENAKNNQKLLELWQQLGGYDKGIVSKEEISEALRAILLIPKNEGQKSIVFLLYKQSIIG